MISGLSKGGKGGEGGVFTLAQRLQQCAERHPYLTKRVVLDNVESRQAKGWGPFWNDPCECHPDRTFYFFADGSVLVDNDYGSDFYTETRAQAWREITRGS
jgi:hypothetical protein